METIVIGSDHAGWELKKIIAEKLQKSNFQVLDIGTDTPIPVDYPDIAVALARVIQGKQATKGIIICGSGVGACVAANKVKGIRASIAHDTYTARQGVEHDDMNILCLGSRAIGVEPAKDIVEAFLNATFSNIERHQKRLDKVIALDNDREYSI